MGQKKKIEVNEHTLSQIETLSGLGLPGKHIAAVLGIDQNTFTKYKKEYPEIIDAIERGIAKARAVVGNSLFKECERGNVPAIKWFEMTRFGLSEKMEAQTGHYIAEPFEKKVARLRGLEYGAREIKDVSEGAQEQTMAGDSTLSSAVGADGSDGMSDE